MSAPHERLPKQADSIHLRMGNLLVALVLILPVTAVDQVPDPLTALFPAIGKNSSWIPLLLGMLTYPLFVFLLKRQPRARQATLSFFAGLALGSLPLLFYWIAHVLWNIQVPLVALAIRGGVAGVFLGALGAWYVPRSHST
ncbi:MAG: hypothetical protein ACJ8OJ_04980 [Povalibacter sp.]